MNTLRRQGTLATLATLTATGAPLAWLGACAGLDEAALTAVPQDEGAKSPATALLTPWQTITGGWRRDAGALPGVAPASSAAGPAAAGQLAGGGLAGSGARLSLILPVGVAVRDDLVLIADGGLRSVLRGLRSQDSLTPWLAYPGPVAEQGASMAIAPDLGAFLALPQQGEVQEFDARGRLVRRHRDEVAAARPVAVAVGSDRSRVFVADALSGRVVVFSAAGRAVEVWGAGARAGATAGSTAGTVPASLQSATALAIGPDGLHVLDRQAQQVVVFDADGRASSAYGEGSLTRPRALAVDAHGRAFVSDDADQALSVFWRGERIARYAAAGAGSAAGVARWRRIDALAIDGNQLYVADAGAARVHVLLIAPPTLMAPPIVRGMSRREGAA